MKKIVYIAYWIFSICTYHIVAAQGGVTLPQITPKSPNVAGFEKYGDVPVSLSKGIADVSIPLTNITVDGLTIPISLSYHNTGLKVDEIPSWVGLGWDLQAGGMISYRQQGINDFDNQGLIANPGIYQNLNSFLAGSMTSDQSFNYLEAILNSQQDSQFDLYYFNFAGFSGSFYFDNNQQAHITPKTDIKILKTGNGLKVQDYAGNQFFFESRENAMMYPLSDVEIKPTFNSVSAFYISKIITRNGRNIQFKYKSYNLQYNLTNQYIVFHPEINSNCPPGGVNYADTYISTDYLLLDAIVFDEGAVNFLTSTTPRQDILKINNADIIPSLAGINVVNKDGKLIKQFNLTAGYFGNNDRLKLMAIQEQNGSTKGRNWQFSYYGDDVNNFPAFFSKGKDHWGFYNGKINSTLIPAANYAAILSPSWKEYLSGNYADRTSDFNASQLSVLKSIKFPTGGTSSFEYEPNQITVDHYGDVTSISPFFQLGGGLVRKQIAGDWTNVQTVTGNGDEHTVSGSFVIPEDGMYNLRIYQDIDPTAFESPIVNFTGPIPGPANIMHMLTQHMTSTSYQGWGDVYLPAGTYHYSLTSGVYCLPPAPCIPLQANFDLFQWVQPSGAIPPLLVGGCRVSKITTSDNTGVNPKMVKRYIYDDKLKDVVFRNIPLYYNLSSIGYLLLPTACNTCGSEYIVHDENVRPFAGSNIEYVNVTELNDPDGSNGKTENTFMTSTDEGGSIYGEPFTEPVNTSWRSGTLIGQKKYKYNGSDYSLVESLDNGYFVSGKQSLINGIKVDYRATCANAISTQWTKHGVSLSTLFSEQFYKNKSVVNEYLNGTISKTENIACQSPNHVLPTLTERFDSKGQSVREKIIYSFDYANSAVAANANALGIKQLISGNILVPIEKIEIKTIGGTDFVVGASLNTYRGDKTELAKSYVLNLPSPLAYSSFKESYIDGSGNFIMDVNYEERVSFNGYDAFNNLVDVSKSNDKHVAYIFDYQSYYPIAEVINGDVNSIAYTSFEADGTGSWVIPDPSRNQNVSITGNNSYNLNSGNSITRNGLNSGDTYIVSYWSTGGTLNVNGSPGIVMASAGAWNYYEHQVTGSSAISISGTATIDELRLFPKGALMTTYTYTPLVGMSSQCTPVNYITYYNYDGLGRLKFLKDTKGNIIKTFEYHYQGQ